MNESLPLELHGLSEEGKAWVLNRRYRRVLGLTLSDDEPARYPSGRIVSMVETINAMQMFARRALGPEKARAEERKRWRA